MSVLPLSILCSIASEVKLKERKDTVYCHQSSGQFQSVSSAKEVVFINPVDWLVTRSHLLIFNEAFWSKKNLIDFGIDPGM